jgi:nitrate reductase assembly molybdenum cofactor insertion protein NarJ
METLRATMHTGSEETLARALLLRLISQALSYPSAIEVGRLLEDDVPLVLSTAKDLPKPIRAALLPFVEALEGATASSLEARYCEVFTHVHSGDCPVYETDYGPRDVWRQSNELADIAGFYRAFGFDPLGERPDHAAVELEFLHVLAYKEAWATAHRDEAHADVCRKATVAFARDHALAWLPALAGRIEVLAGAGPYAVCARLLNAWCAAESERIGVALPEDLPAPGNPSGLEDDAPGFCEVEP